MPKQRILIVDDEPAMRRYLWRVLEPLGHDLTEAENGEEGLNVLRGSDFDLVISDLKMPKMDGLTLLQNLRGEGCDAAFILLTAYADLGTALAARDQYNISNFLVKPLHNQDQFLFDVNSALYRRQLEQRNHELMDAITTANQELESKVEERTRELVEKNQELARLSQFRSDVLRVLSHELRTPLAILGGYLNLKKAAFDHEEPRVYPLMEGALERVQGIVDQSIRRMREAEITHFDLDIGPVDPGVLCRTLVDRIQPLLISRQLTIEVGASPVGECQWDSSRVESIVEELLTNAVRATEDGGRIQVSTAESNGRVEFSVRDSGPGIPPEEKERVFEPFVTLGRADHHTSGLFAYMAQGVGLGLSIAKILAELQQGTLTARPNDGEPGTTFCLSLPRTVVSA